MSHSHVTRACVYVISLPKTGFSICPASHGRPRLRVSHRFPHVPCQPNDHISAPQLVQTFQPFLFFFPFKISPNQSLSNLHPPSSQSGEAAKPIYNLSTHHTRLCLDLAHAPGPVGQAWSQATPCLQSPVRASSHLSSVELPQLLSPVWILSSFH